MSEFAKEVLPVDLEDEMRQSYLDYAMSVIIGRALPDVRDGLKPVHRRVLFAMRELGNEWNKPYKKSARVVGDVIGKYHPHGDTAVYDTYAGQYAYAILTVTRQGDRVFAQMTGQPKVEIFAKSPTEFFWKVVKAKVEFVKNEAGKITNAIHRQGGG